MLSISMYISNLIISIIIIIGGITFDIEFIQCAWLNDGSIVFLEHVVFFNVHIVSKISKWDTSVIE